MRILISIIIAIREQFCRKTKRHAVLSPELTLYKGDGAVMAQSSACRNGGEILFRNVSERSPKEIGTLDYHIIISTWNNEEKGAA
jgi:hypothetical protein